MTDQRPTHHALTPGERVVWKASGETGVVLGRSGELVEVAFATGTRLVSVGDLEPSERDPATRLAAGEVGRSLPYALRLQALFLRHAYRFDPLSGLSNARVEPQLHQVFVAHLVTNKLQPRMILADEVASAKPSRPG
jgi:hypothetical protein